MGKRWMDLFLAFLGAAIALIGFLYLEGPARWGYSLFGVALAGIFCAMAARDGRGPAAAAVLDESCPPGAEVTEVVLLSEENQPLASWPLYGKMGLVIGRDVGENQVNINLSASAYASMIARHHAVLNYSAGSWYVEDLASMNGVSVQKRMDGRKYKLAPDQPCKLDPGDIIYIGLARLMIR